MTKFKTANVKFLQTLEKNLKKLNNLYELGKKLSLHTIVQKEEILLKILLKYTENRVKQMVFILS